MMFLTAIAEKGRWSQIYLPVVGLTTKGNFVNERTDSMKLADVLFYLGIILVLIGCYLVNIVFGIFMTGLAFIGVSFMLVASNAIKDAEENKKT